MSSENTSQVSPQLAQAIESIGVGENAELELLKFLIARASEKDPVLGEAIRFCAIPRRFNAETIGALRQAPDDRETNDALFSKIVSFSFARKRPNGTYKYNDGTREALLGEWSAPEKREQFDRLNQHLVDFYKAESDKIVRLEPDLASVAAVLHKANTARHVQVTSIFQRQLVGPLLEALYHKSLISAEACYKYFERLYQDHEARGQLIVCESLLTGTRDCLERLPADSGTEPWFKWLQYWKARLKREFREEGRAAEILNELLPQTEADTQLKLWVLGDLGAIYYQQSKLREAGEKYKQVIEIASTSGEDPYNLPLWYQRLAQLHAALDEFDESEENYRKAIAFAGDNVWMEIAAQGELAGVLYTRGNWEEALNTAIATVHLARTRLPGDKRVYRVVLDQLMELLARRHPELLDTIFHESKALIDTTDPLPVLGASRQYLTLLRKSGQLARADEQLELVSADAAPQQNQLLNIELELEKSLLLEEHGQLHEAIAVYDQLLIDTANHESAAWYSAAAVTNRGMLRSKIGLCEEAVSDLAEAAKKWRAMSHDSLEGFIYTSLATVQRQQGRLSEAQHSLDRAAEIVGNTQSTYLSDLYEEQAEMFKARGQRAEARLHFEKALERYRRADSFKQAAKTLAQLTMIASDDGDWERAALCANEATAFWEVLATINAYRPNEAAKRADKDNAECAQAFFVQSDDRLKLIDQAREKLLRACQEVPDNFWYRLNLAYAFAELQQWSEAAETIRRTLTDVPQWLRVRMLYQRLADYQANQGQVILSKGNYAEAAEFHAQSRSDLEGHVDFERIAEIDLKLGDSFLRLDKLDAAQAEYEKGLARAEQQPVTADEGSALKFQAGFRGRLGLVEALRSASSKVLEHFRANISLRRQQDAATLVDDLVALVDEFSDVVKTTTQYRTLGDALRAVSDDPEIEVVQRQRLIGAQLTLSERRYRQTRSPSAGAIKTTIDNLPVALPIMVEADARLFPLAEATPEVNRMLQVEIPMMRQDLLNSTGVNVPGVRIRSNDNYEAGRYVLSLDEVPIASGQVYAQAKFCPDAARCDELEIKGERALNPVDGTTGIWVSEVFWKQAAEAGLQLQDAYQFMIFHLGSLLRKHLETFLGVQEVDGMLAQWNSENEQEKQTLLNTAVADDGALVRLTQVLQQLVKEDVPVRNLLAILTAFAEANASTPELIHVTEQVRMALRSDLPVNKGIYKLVGLSKEFEDQVAPWIQEQDGKRFLAAPSQQSTEWLRALQDHFGDQPDDQIALIVSASELRPFIWRFVYNVYPSMLVSAARELIDGTRLPEEKVALTA